jgi:hypothetical protein
MRTKSLFKIKYAQTFVFKSRCKFCKSGPHFLYFLMKGNVNEKNFCNTQFSDKNVSQTKSFLADDFYVGITVKNRNFRPSYLFDGNTMLHRSTSVPNSKFEENKDKYVSILECICGRTNWLFTDSKRQHIKNRKCPLVIRRMDLARFYGSFE